MRSPLLSSSAFPLVFLIATLSLGGCSSSAEETPVELVRPPVGGEVQAYTRLESRVVALESQMRAAQPTLKKVEVMEGHFKALSLELDRIAKDYPQMEEERASGAAPAPVVPVAREVPKKDVVKKEVAEPVADTKPDAKIELAKQSPDELAVTSVRIGEQGKETTRIVLDTTKAAELRYDLDNGEGLLVIDVPAAKWMAAESSNLKKSPMVKSFHASSDEAGAHLVIELKQTAKVTATARLSPSGASGHRVYVDVAPAK